MKTISILLLALFLGKGCSEAQKNALEKTVLQYEANTRGFYQKITINNQIVMVNNDRDGREKPTSIKISDKNWKELQLLFKDVKLDGLAKLKDPTQKRFYDGAAIATFYVKHLEKEYQTTEFDNGFPPAEIEKIVNKIIEISTTKK